MRHDDLRVLLHHGRDVDDGDLLFQRRIGLDHVVAHVEIDLSGRQEDQVVGLRAARKDRDVEAVFGIGPIGHGLIEPAMLGFSQPIRAHGDTIGCHRRERRERGESRQHAS